jgi:4-amino-4-deoxy-L-arabinose transferase
MIDSNNWIVPTLNGFKYFEKPVLGYWLNAISMKFFGENNFGIRFMSALSAFLTTLLLFFMVRTLYDDRDSFYISLIYFSYTSVYLIGTTAVLDSILNFFLTAASISFYFFLQSKSPKKKSIFILLSGVSLGSAFLTKGFLVFAVTGITLIPYILWEILRYKKLMNSNENQTDSKLEDSLNTLNSDENNSLIEQIRKTSLPKFIFQIILFSFLIIIPLAVIIAPWALEIHKQTHGFWHYFIVEEHIKRFISAKAQHSQPFFYYIIILPVLCMPWTLMLPLIITKFGKIKKVITSHPLLRYSACWFIFPFIFFSLSKGKLPTYILPCMPPLAIMFFALIKNTVVKISQTKNSNAESNENNNTEIPEFHFSNKRNRFFNFMVKTLMLALLTATVMFVIYQYYGIPIKGKKFFIFDNKFEKTKEFSVLITSTMIILCLYKLSQFKDFYKKIIILFIITALIYITILTSIPYVMIKNSKKVPGDFINSFKNKITPQTVIASDHTLMTAACWFTKKNDVYLLLSSGEINLKLNKKQKARYLKDNKDFKIFLKEHKHQNIIVFMTAKHYYKDVIKRARIPSPKQTYINGKLAALFY